MGTKQYLKGELHIRSQYRRLCKDGGVDVGTSFTICDLVSKAGDCDCKIGTLVMEFMVLAIFSSENIWLGRRGCLDSGLDSCSLTHCIIASRSYMCPCIDIAGT
ncbi:unnamed protein product [Rotaria magnacalcarata]|uniref:Uncharacterized protein n=1 Tax=Rotaria magnacalcarata TaxID=392030 RepID=A0A815GKJ1_9BILA|nr:unnamed protein product [Rotaria magnacalcarata]CAF1590846.1 unnamed protein product [Rotaria magnacalcarata]CAF2063141.1 unnamed protein product [Rotaria magnacalcarata]CAF3831397.1 unnamed protein product [Rotaria magnacalcarata]CAF3949022.1 unnamed protein product [Rotaria magnacalcarata]